MYGRDGTYNPGEGFVAYPLSVDLLQLVYPCWSGMPHICNMHNRVSRTLDPKTNIVIYIDLSYQKYEIKEAKYFYTKMQTTPIHKRQDQLKTTNWVLEKQKCQLKHKFNVNLSTSSLRRHSHESSGQLMNEHQQVII